MGVFLIIIAICYPTPFLLWEIYKCHLVKSMGKADTIFYLIVSLLPIVSHFSHLLSFLFYMDSEGKFNKEKDSSNRAYKCDTCNITSRKYQLKGVKYKNRCPHCDSRVYSNSSIDDDKSYPFAPKLTTFEFVRIIRENNKLNRLHEDLLDVESRDKELESYEQLQLKKLKELEAKANEIREELAKGSVN